MDVTVVQFNWSLKWLSKNMISTAFISSDRSPRSYDVTLKTQLKPLFEIFAPPMPLP